MCNPLILERRTRQYTEMFDVYSMADPTMWLKSMNTGGGA